MSDNDSLVRDKSIDLNNIEVQLEGGQRDSKVNSRQKSITLEISVNKNDDNEMEFDID